MFFVVVVVGSIPSLFPQHRYEHIQMGKIKVEDAGSVPDVYAKNQKLSDRVKFLELEVDRYKKAAEYVFWATFVIFVEKTRNI